MFQSFNGIITTAILLAGGLGSLAKPAPRQSSILATLRPAADVGLCMDVFGGIIADDTPIEISACVQTAAQNWQFTRGSTTNFQLAGTKFCLDAGPIPTPGTGLQLFTCLDNLPSQSFFYDPIDNRIQLGNTGLCLTVTLGSLPAPKLQVWPCGGTTDEQSWVNVPVKPPTMG